jgi:predicted DNA-binding antitoxin AbrB/MazE fold protein
MSESIEAIYEKGVFRPLQPVNLPENSRVQISVPDGIQSQSSAQIVAAQQLGIRQMLAETAKLPSHEPDDGLSNRDHDRILYGDR